MQLAKTLRNELGKPLPLVLHLSEAKADATTVWNRALLTLRTENKDKDHPIHCHFFEGGLAEYQDWIQFFPRTMFSINAKSLTKHLSTGHLVCLRQVPLTRVTLNRTYRIVQLRRRRTAPQQMPSKRRENSSTINVDESVYRASFGRPSSTQLPSTDRTSPSSGSKINKITQ